MIKQNIKINTKKHVSARKSIGRFDGKNKFSNVEFLKITRALYDKCVQNIGPHSFIQHVELNLDDVENIDLVEKMDSSFIRFGINENDKFFMESSNSGEVTYENYEKVFQTLTDFKLTFKSLYENKNFIKSLRSISSTIGPVRYDAELFPVLTHQGDDNGYITFIATKYKKSAFGSDGSLVVFKTSIWDTLEKTWYRPVLETSVQLMEHIKQLSYHDMWADVWKIYTNESDLKLSGKLILDFKNLNNILNDDKSYNHALVFLKSKKRTSEKIRICNILNGTRKSLQSCLDKFAQATSSKLGGTESYIEGVVLRIKNDDGSMYEIKGTSKKFDENKKQLWFHRNHINSLEKKLIDKILTSIYGFDSTSPVALNKFIRTAAESFNPVMGDIKFEDQFYIHMLLKCKSIENKNLSTDFKEFYTIYTQIKSDFERNKLWLDPDTAQKTYVVIDDFYVKFMHIKQLLSTYDISNNPGCDLLKACINRRVGRIINFETGNGIPDDDKKRVIVWVGRAQPWHRGHHEMIKLGKEKLTELNADAVLIMLVRGGESSKNLKKNPLNTKQQLHLVKSLYENDDKIFIYDKPIQSSYATTVVNTIYKLNYRIVGWLAGTDRMSAYKENIQKFSPNEYAITRSYSPVSKNCLGKPLIKFIETPRIMRATDARDSVVNLNFDDWFNFVAPENVCENAVGMYRKIYDSIQSISGSMIKLNDKFNAIQIF